MKTGIFKQPVKEALHLSFVNLDGDEQADLVNHGGPDKAMCVYPYEHYAHWEKELSRPLAPAAFGENLTVNGMLEPDICIGDIFQIGDALVQVSQPRKPCHKLAKRYDRMDLPRLVLTTGFTGFYFRVIREGIVAPDSTISLVEKHPLGLTVSFVNQAMHGDQMDRAAIEKLAGLQELAANWRQAFEKKRQELNNSETE
ncbi:MOSC domain-containing protein [Effusibacillus dendaii]|uniref:MOSC domain-containing protein n=1 Tax=Effusibacillus dendaii TaxID=2743772 RepID=UPI001CF7CC0F|nr:MOSC domain-containing protein [Effusibacillus dendaii]